MKHLLLLFFFLHSYSFLHCQDWQWVQTAGGDNSQNVGKSVTTDPLGNAIVTGFYRSHLRMHQNSLGDAIVELAGYERKDNRMFLAKYGEDGQLRWVNYAKGYFAEGSSVTTDEQGCIYVTGSFSESTVFSSQDNKQQELKGFSPGMMFLAKYSPTGRLLWVVKGGSQQGQSGGEALVVVNGQVFVAGQAETVSGDPLIFMEAGGKESRYTPVKNVPFGTSKVGFVAVYDLRGRIQGVRFLGGSQAEVNLTDIAVDAEGRCYVAGLLTGRMSLQGRVLETKAFSTEGFCLALKGNGDLEWAARIKGAVDPESGPQLALTGNNLALAYTGKGSTLFTVEKNGLETQSPEGSHLGLVLLSQEGQLQWHQYAAMSRGKVVAQDLAVDSKGGVLVGGYYLGELVLSSQTLGSSGFHREQTQEYGEFSWWDKNAFVIRYHPEGYEDWVKISQGIQEEVANGLAINNKNQVYVTGYFVSGGEARLGPLSMRALGKVNVFLAQYGHESEKEAAAEVMPVASLTRSDNDLRKTVDKESISVSSKKLVISLWDNHMVDGDIISLYANDQCILKNYKLEGSTTTLTLELGSGEHRLLLRAENTGRIYPNTAAITIDDGKFRQTVLLASDLNRSEAVKIRVQ